MSLAALKCRMRIGSRVCSWCVDLEPLADDAAAQAAAVGTLLDEFTALYHQQSQKLRPRQIDRDATIAECVAAKRFATVFACGGFTRVDTMRDASLVVLARLGIAVDAGTLIDAVDANTLAVDAGTLVDGRHVRAPAQTNEDGRDSDPLRSSE